MTNRVKQYLLLFLHTQLIVTLIALPILVHWGLSLSLMTFVGNLLFAPILSIFILLSSILFFCELLNIPNYYIAESLNILVTLWKHVLSYGKKSWLISFAHPGIVPLVCIIFLTILVVRNKYITNNKNRIICLTIVLLASTIYLYQVPTKHVSKHVLEIQEKKYKNKFSIIYHKDNSMSFIDDGYFNSKRSIEKTLSFELKPFLVKKFGSKVIHELILLRPGYRSFKGAIAFCNIFTVKKVTFPYFKKKLSKGGWYFFYKLKRLLQSEDIFLSRHLPANLKKKNRKKANKKKKSAIL